MSISYSGLYQDATLFDQLAQITARQLRGWLPRDPARRWSWLLRAQGAGFAVLAAGLLIAGTLAADSFGAALVAVSASAGLLATARFFISRAQAPLPARRRANAAIPQERPAPATPAIPSSGAGAPGIPASAPEMAPREFLHALRDAGVNVRIAKALFTAGVRSPEAVRRHRDTSLLAIKGVGPATLSRLRHTFG